MVGKTSIIVAAYDTVRLQRWITSACVGNISKYTDREDYELILVDQQPQGGSGDLNQRFNDITVIDKWLKPEGNLGCSAAMNLGVKNSDPTSEYICFLHNDVLVWEGWLKTLRSFLEEGYCDIIYPAQSCYNRQHIKEMAEGDRYMRGNDDAGLTMMTRDAFNKTGGWDERFKTIYMDLMFRKRFASRVHCTAKCVITHITCGTLWAWSPEEEQRAYNEESVYFKQ